MMKTKSEILNDLQKILKKGDDECNCNNAYVIDTAIEYIETCV